MSDNEKLGNNPIIIEVNHERFPAPKPIMTGKEIKELGHCLQSSPLFMSITIEPRGDVKIIADDLSVDLEHEMCFHTGVMITIGTKLFPAPKPTMTGKEIKELGNSPEGHLLVLVVGEPDEVAGGDDKIIANDLSVDLKPGIRFRIVNPATFG